jgi:hypothetical protein
MLQASVRYARDYTSSKARLGCSNLQWLFAFLQSLIGSALAIASTCVTPVHVIHLMISRVPAIDCASILMLSCCLRLLLALELM